MSVAETTPLPPPQLTPEVPAVLARLRARIRRYVWLEGLATGAAWLGLAFWASLGTDWFFEPSAAVRIAMLGAIGLVLLGILVQLVGRRALARLPDSSMALLLERRFPQFNESLLTAVELTGRRRDVDVEGHGDGWSPEMLARTCRQAAAEIGAVRLRRVFNPRPLRRRLGSAVLLAGAVAVFAAARPAEVGVWARRNLLLADELWPRRTHLSVEGFPGGVVKVARGSDLELVARVDTARSVLVPQVVQVRYRIEGGPRVRASMSRLGTADPGVDPFQQYAYTFRGLLAPVRLDVFGGDSAVRDLRIEVVDSPTIKMELAWEYPSYIDLPPRRAPVTGTMQLPAGSRVVVHAAATKDLARVQIDTVTDDHPGPPQILAIDPRSADRRAFQQALPRLVKDTTLLFTLVDTDGIRTREPVRLSLAAVRDEPPRLAVQLRGVGPAITPKARLPVAGQVTDDYGIAKIWFDHAVDQGPAVAHPLAEPAPHTVDFQLDEGLEVQPLGLQPGHKLLVSVKAADRCDSSGGPNVGTSERWVLDVVTPEQLRAMLEARELVLRQRFEAIVQEVSETRDLLVRVEFGGPARAKADQAQPQKTAAKALEPGDDAGEARADTPERFRAMQTLRVERAQQNGRKNAQETLGVAEAFDDIRQQLVNNRIDTEQLIQRVKGGIADPLRAISGEMFPELDRRLEALRAALGDETLGPPLRVAAREQVDAILTAMRAVLDKMLELESFNEAIELLRSIIQTQEKLDAQTKQRHKDKLRDLLKE